MISIGSNKLVNQAQAVIVYYEQKRDLDKLQDLINIYSGVPLKFYFGNKDYLKSNHYFSFSDATQMVDHIIKERENILTSSERVYQMFKENVGKGENDDLLVSDILKGFDPNQ